VGANLSHAPGALADRLRWFYRDGPHGNGKVYMLHARGQPIGCAGIGVRRFVDRGQSVRAALFADSPSMPHRTGLPALTLLRAVHRMVTRDFEVGYGYPNLKQWPSTSAPVTRCSAR